MGLGGLSQGLRSQLEGLRGQPEGLEDPWGDKEMEKHRKLESNSPCVVPLVISHSRPLFLKIKRIG